MTQLAPHPAYLAIEDRLDAVGQKYRVQRIVRGGMLFVSGLIAATLVAALLASVMGQSRWTWLVLAGWWAWVGVTALLWLVRPIFVRPRLVEVARLVEGRVAGLHNGLTNSVLLARAGDMRDSPWLGPIFEEVAGSAGGQSLDQAVKLTDLRPLAWRLGIVVGVAVVLMVLLPARFAHGWQQLFSPSAFVPRSGAFAILEVQPKDVTLVAGQALEISVLARGPGAPNAKLIFDAPGLPPAELVATVEGEQLHYTYRLDHLDQSTKYRVEVGGTQSPWYTASVVQQVKWTGLVIQVTPPPYTRREASSLTLTPENIGKTPVSVPQGSKLDFVANVDVPVAGAMLQAGEAAPVAMEGSGVRFTGSLTVLEDTAISVLLTQGSGQIIARLPDPSLAIHCTADEAPRIEMKWPNQDSTIAPTAEVKLSMGLKDDYGLSSARVLMAASDATSAQAAPGATPVMTAVAQQQYEPGKTAGDWSVVLKLKPEQRRHGQSIRVQVEATDNRALSALLKEGGPQTTTSAIYEIKFRDPEQIAREQKEALDKLRGLLLEMLKTQQALHGQALTFKAGDAALMKKIQSGQSVLRGLMQKTAETFAFDETNKIVQKTLLVLAYNPAKEAVDLAGAILTEPLPSQQVKLNGDLQSKQRRIVSTLESLLALLNASAEPATQPSQKAGGDLVNKKEEYQKLHDALKEFVKEQQRILDATAPLAKKPVDDWDDKDKKLLDDLKMSQEKLDAFMQEKVNDFSKLAEQDMANASMLKELMEIYSEVTMAKDALKQKAVEIAVSAEEMGLELAKEQNANLEKWLMDTPDRQKWTQEDPITKQDIPMPELPTELEDMIGKLMEQEEDLFDEMEDTNANWTDSMDKGAGWDAADGPIADMSAKGVTGNQLPNNNEMGGRAGEGRSGKSQGEMVEDTATGKGGRRTPTRLDPTAFQQGQVKDESKDPVGGATGGGKLSGQGGAGLEGPVPTSKEPQMQRLAQKQAEIRNAAEKINLKYQLGRYDNFKLLESIALMRRTESDLNANRYQNALRRRDVVLDNLDASRLLLSGRIHVQQDTSPTMSKKTEEQIHDAMQGQLPAAWSDALKEYYRKLGQE
jgi:hypothetical protein